VLQVQRVAPSGPTHWTHRFRAAKAGGLLVWILHIDLSMRVSSAENLVKIEPSLETLMAAYTAGQSEAFRELHRRLAPRLYSYLLRLSRDPALAEDVLQATFAKLHRARTTYLPGAKVMPWAMVIARRTFLDECRGLAAQREVLGADGVLPEGKPELPSPDHVADMKRALDRLPDHYRSAIQLTKLVGFSGEEAAGLLSTTQSAVKLRVHRGYAMLRTMLTGSPAAA
jgi:RNA polymerase sigma-70 factor (ECF subfamily)